MTSTTHNRQFWVVCLLVCIVAFALRLPHLQNHSLWMDETYSAWFSSLPLHELWTDVPLYETHPPMYYTLLKFWRLAAGASEAGLRSLSVLASVATVLVLAVSGRALKAGKAGDQVALLAALFLAVNQGSINYAQQARPYALETLTATLAILASVRLLIQLRPLAVARTSSGAALRLLLAPMAVLALAAGATLWLHNTAILIAAGIWAGMIVSLLVFVPQNRAMQIAAVALPGIGALLVWSPFLPMFIRQNQGMSHMTYWMDFHMKDGLGVGRLVAGPYLWMNPIILLAALGLWRLWRTDRLAGLHLSLILTLPLGFILAYSHFRQPVFVDRLFEWMAPPVMVLAAIGVMQAVRSATWRGATAVVALGFCLFHTVKSYADGPNEDWKGWLTRLQQEAHKGDLVILVQNEIEMPLHYYAGAGFPDVLSLPAAFPARGLPRAYIGNPGAPGMTPSDQDTVRAAMAGHPRIWLIQRAAHLYDANGIVRKEVASSRTLVEHYGPGNVTIELFEGSAP
jgi:hypothetical protein